MSSDKKEREPVKKQDPAPVEANGGELSRRARAERRQKILAFIVSLAVACGLWFYVMAEVNPTTQRSFSGIKVDLLNSSELTANNLVLAETEDHYVRVRLSGRRQALMTLDSSDIVATADVSECSAGDNYLDVQIRKQSSVNVENVSPSQIRIEIEQIVSEERQITVYYTGTSPSGYQPVTTAQEYSAVQITGAESAVHRVTEIRAEVSVEKLSAEGKTMQVKLNAVDKKGNPVSGVKLSQNKISVSAQMYSVKSVELSAGYAGTVADGYQLTGFEVPETVEVAVPVSYADIVVSVTAEPVDLTDLKKNTSVDLVLNLPDNVQLADGQKTPQAEITVAKIAARSMKFDTEDIEVQNLPEGLVLSFDEASVEITLKGTSAELSKIRKSDITLSVNAAWVNRSVKELPLAIGFPDEDGSVKISAEEVSVPVTIR